MPGYPITEAKAETPKATIIMISGLIGLLMGIAIGAAIVSSSQEKEQPVEWETTAEVIRKAEFYPLQDGQFSVILHCDGRRKFAGVLCGSEKKEPDVILNTTVRIHTLKGRGTPRYLAIEAVVNREMTKKLGTSAEQYMTDIKARQHPSVAQIEKESRHGKRGN